MAENNRPGLPSLNASRATRYRQLTTGKTAIGGIPPKMFLGGLLILVLGGIAYFRKTQGELEDQRAALMAKQRAVAAALGPKLLPLQTAVEKNMMELVASKDEQLSAGADYQKLLATPGLYLRLRAADARSPKSIRKAAQDSLRDGFSSCLMRDPKAVAPQAGKECKESTDCQSGELCTEFKVCQRPSSPFNMRLMYRALSVLSEEWTGEVRGASNELGLTAYERGLDSVTRVDIPVAIEIYQRAKYFVLVADLDPPEGLPKPIAGLDETALESVQRVAHTARVAIGSLPSGRILARFTAEAAGGLRDAAGGHGPSDAVSTAGRTRQATSCGLALEVLGRLTPPVAEPASDSAAPTTGAPPTVAP